MKVFSITGVSASGKTTTVEAVAAELRRRNYTVGSVKDIHFEGYAMDQEGTNTYRHKAAGSQLVTARGLYETDVLFQARLSLGEILRFYDHDFVILEGAPDFYGPGIITAHTEAEIELRMRTEVFAISGQIANRLTIYRGLPVINAMTGAAKLVDLIEAAVTPWTGQPEWIGQEGCHE
jgi:molybdopterin-guanine dinucleotide biosynthesis protein B